MLSCPRPTPPRTASDSLSPAGLARARDVLAAQLREDTDGADALFGLPPRDADVGFCWASDVGEEG